MAEGRRASATFARPEVDEGVLDVGSALFQLKLMGHDAVLVKPLGHGRDAAPIEPKDTLPCILVSGSSVRSASRTGSVGSSACGSGDLQSHGPTRKTTSRKPDSTTST